jgi:hypothetical protein
VAARAVVCIKSVDIYKALMGLVRGMSSHNIPTLITPLKAQQDLSGWVESEVLPPSRMTPKVRTENGHSTLI